MEPIITRFPPSPTGYLHVGGARTALFNWLYAKNKGGKFVLRIEDTDLERSTPESVAAIFESLEWLGIDWDEGPFFQTKRFDIYKEYIDKLVETGHAYYCTCSPEEVEEMRNKARAEGRNPKYDGTCRDKGLKSSENSVIRFRAPEIGNMVIEDIIKGSIVMPNSELDDFIIQRSDGSPTYNLAVAVDDITMGINTILRGDDHINNTPKQMLIYKALGVELPTYGHLPMVLGGDKTRLSKRHGAMSVTEYREMGFLPDAVLNYLARLGWSHGDQEFFTREELIEKFDINHIGRSAGVFDTNKLLALNFDHIKQADSASLVDPLKYHLKKRGCDPENDEKLAKAIETLSGRSKTLEEMADGALFYFNDITEYDPKAVKKCFKGDVRLHLELLSREFAAMDDFVQANMEEAFKFVMEEVGLGFGKIAQSVRVALCGTNVSPGIFEMLDVLGKDESVKRINAAIEFVKAELN